MSLLLLSSLSLARREWVRFVRQPGRIAGALGTPLLFWGVLGAGFGRSFQPGGPGYLSYFYPGTIAMVLLFASIFSTISIIEDRREGFLQGVLVSPAPRAGIALGKILGGSVVASVQGILLVALAPLLDLPCSARSLLLSAGAVFLLSFALTGLGFLFAWRSESVQGFHAVMNLLLFPMWILSGAVFPVETAPPWLATLMTVNPMTYGLAALRDALQGTAALPLALSAAFAAATLLLSFVTVRERR